MSRAEPKPTETVNAHPVPATVDVHTHFFPAGLGDLAASTGDERWPSLHIDEHNRGRIMRGDSVFRPVAAVCWDPLKRRQAMDESGVDVQVLSPVPVTLTTWAEPALAASFARRQNEALAGAAATAPDRYRWLGSVPLQDTDAAIAELEHATTQLGMAGVEIGTEVDGRELDDAALRPFFVAAAELDVPIFVHPTDGAHAIRRGGQPYEFGLGMLTDTAMAAAALVFGGVLDDVPTLRIGLAHGCGSFAWAYPRLARGTTMGPAAPPLALARTDALVRALWVDSLVFDPRHVPLLIERFGSDHIMLGSDFPFYPPAWGGSCDVLDNAARLGLCTDNDIAAIKSAKGLRFLGVDVHEAGHC